MNFLKYTITALIFFLSNICISAQKLTGKVIEETGCLPVRVAEFENLENLSAQWQTPLQQLKKVNMGIISNNGNEAFVNMPLPGKLTASDCGVCSPVIHKVQKGEGLYRIGLWYGIKSTAALKQLNSLRSDALQPGQELIVGYISNDLLKSNPVVKGEIPLAEDKRRENNKVDETGALDSAISGTNTKMKEPEKVIERPVLKYEGEGFFNTEFKQEGEKSARKKMKTATFKSASGWEDGRFYLLSNQIRTGVVVKVTNPANGEFLYAKVVGPMPDIKQNNGLQLRLSNAAAIKLGYNGEDEVHELDLAY